MTNGKPNRRTKTQIKVRIPNTTHDALHQIMAARGTTLTQEVTRALASFVEQQKQQGAR
jgi:predicted HicB family RNase H-like nuclease